LTEDSASLNSIKQCEISSMRKKVARGYFKKDNYAHIEQDTVDDLHYQIHRHCKSVFCRDIANKLMLEIYQVRSMQSMRTPFSPLRMLNTVSLRFIIPQGRQE
jgi:hypothetical protein